MFSSDLIVEQAHDTPTSQWPSLVKSSDQLTAMLAEYTALRGEIQNRSDFQNRIVQLHVTALTAIIGLAVTGNHVEVIAIIPLEACIFGLWYFDHAFTITDVGDYLVGVEKRANFLLGCDRCMDWESSQNRREGNTSKLRKNILTCVMYLTFVAPAIIAFSFTVLVLMDQLAIKYQLSLETAGWILVVINTPLIILLVTLAWLSRKDVNTDS